MSPQFVGEARKEEVFTRRESEIKNQQEPALIITHIHPSSLGHRTRAIRIGSLIEEVNGVQVKTLEKLRELVGKTAHNGFVTIKATHGAFVAFPFKQMVFDEVRLSYDYRYPITPFIKSLLEQIQTTEKLSNHQKAPNIPGAVGVVVPA